MPNFNYVSTCHLSLCSIDVDECVTQKDNCNDHAACRNNDGSFSCQCHPGFTGNGIECESKLLYIIFGRRVAEFLSDVSNGISHGEWACIVGMLVL